MKPAESIVTVAVFLGLTILPGACRKDAAPTAGRPAALRSAEERSARLPRDFPDFSLGLGLTLAEARTRLPDLRPAESIAFSAAPAYDICDEIGRTQEYLLMTQQAVPAEAFQAHPRAAGLKTLTLYVLNGSVSAVRGLYDESVSRTVPYLDFVGGAASRYGRPMRAESIRFSDGTRVAYALWQDGRTAILLGETRASGGAILSRYVYFIDDGLLAQSYEAARRRGRNYFDKVTF